MSLSEGFELWPCLADAGAVARIRNRSLLEAWSSWQEFCDLQHAKREQLALAVNFWRQRELAMAFTEFRYAGTRAHTCQLA